MNIFKLIFILFVFIIFDKAEISEYYLTTTRFLLEKKTGLYTPYG